MPEPVLLFSCALACTALGFFFGWWRFGRRLRSIEKSTWAAAAHFYTAKARE